MLTGGRKPLAFEYVSQVPTAGGADDFGAGDTEGGIVVSADGSGDGWWIQTRRCW